MSRKKTNSYKYHSKRFLSFKELFTLHSNETVIQYTKANNLDLDTFLFPA